MSQAHTSIPSTKPASHSANLRLTPQTPASQVGAPPPQASSPKPLISGPLERLLSLYLDDHLTLADIAFTLNLSIVETIERTEDPAFLKLLETYTAAQDKRVEALARLSRIIALRTLAQLAETCDKPETSRKAACDIIRMAPKAKPELITHDLRIRAVHAYAKLTTPYTREVLSPILGPTPPQKSTA